MSTEANKTLYRRWFEEVVTGRNLALADELLAADYVLHFPGMPPLDREGHKQLLGMFHAAFPDWRETVEAVVAEGDLVVIRVTGSGTHEGHFRASRRRTNGSAQRVLASAGSRTGSSRRRGPSTTR
jgi:ketosteroid isomerase-like protein